MTLQQFIDFDQFVRCYCVGQQEVMVMAYDPRKPYLSGEQYVHDPNYLAPKLAERVKKDVRTLCTALGYDLNTVEFAIKDGVPYAIDFMNPAPDAELASVGEFYHNWITSAVTDLIFRRLAEPRERSRYRWDAMLNPEPTQTSAVASVTEQQGRTILPRAGASSPKEKSRAAGATFDNSTVSRRESTRANDEPSSSRRSKSVTGSKTPSKKPTSSARSKPAL